MFSARHFRWRSSRGTLCGAALSLGVVSANAQQTGNAALPVPLFATFASPWSPEEAFWAIGLLMLAGLPLLAWAIQVRFPFWRADAAGTASGKRESRLPSAARIAGILCAAIGFVVLAGGWGLDIAVLRALVPGHVAMKANTALGLLLAGVALAYGAKQSGAGRLAAVVGAGAAALLGSLILFEYVSGFPLGIDELLFLDHTPTGGPFPGRMAPASACMFVLAGSSLLLIRRERWVLWGQALACISGLLCWLNLVGVLYGVPNFFGITAQIGMAVHTAIAFVILSAGTLFLRPSAGLMATVTSDAPGGYLARRLLPAAFLAPTALGWLRWQGQLHGLYNSAVGVALFASSNIAVFAVLIWTSAKLLNRSDADRVLAESSFRASENRYRTVVESLPQMVWTCLPDGRCDYLNQRWIDYTGVPEEEHLGFGWLDAVHAEDRASVHEAWLAAVRSGGAMDAPYRVRGRNGEYRWFRALAVPLRDPQGTPVKWFGTSTDIQSLKTAEMSLRDSEAELRELADAMPQIVWAALPSGEVIYYNQRWHEYTGTTFDETKGWGWRPAIHPDDQQQCTERWSSSVASGAVYEAEYRLRRASDGAYRWHLGRAVPVRNAAGEIVRWFGTSTDVDDYKHAEAEIKALNENLEKRVLERTTELVQTRARLQSVLDAATQVSIILTDTSRVIRLFNSGSERMLQYTAGEVTGVCGPEVFHDPAELAARLAEHSQQLGRRATLSEVFTANAREGESDEREWTYIRKDGSTLDVSVAITAVHDAEGRLTGFLRIATDITARKALERQLRRNNEQLAEQTRKAEEANRAKSEFLANMSHEIRTPMNGILGMAALVRDTPLTPGQREHLNLLTGSAETLLKIINDILDFSKVEAGKLDFEDVPFDLGRVLEATLGEQALPAQEKNISLSLAIDPEVDVRLRGDPVRLRQVLTNLVGNAVKFTQDGAVSVRAVLDSVHGSSQTVHFSIADTGIGIPPEKQRTIFDPFCQADSSMTRRYGGTGLGLAISARLVEMMEGRIWVESAPHRGSCFHFTATFQEVESEAAAPESQSPAMAPVQQFLSEAAPGRNGSAAVEILVAEDNAVNQRLLVRLLEKAGYSVSVAENGREVLNLLDQAQFDLIFMDVQMPEMDGFEATARIREREQVSGGRVPIIAMTAHAMKGDREKCLAAGMDDYLSKPVRFEEVLASIPRILDSKPLKAC